MPYFDELFLSFCRVLEYEIVREVYLIKEIKMSLKYLFIVLLPFLLYANSQLLAQDVDKKVNGLTFGLTHSVNTTRLHGDFPSYSYLNVTESNSTYSRVTFDVGINIDYYLSPMFSIQMDATYSSMGTVLENTTTLYSELGKVEGYNTNRIVLDYIKIPLAINFYPHEMIYMNVGGYGSTLISSRFYSRDSESEDLDYKFNNVDAGIIAGGGVSLAYVKLGLQYSYGLMNVVTNDNELDLRNGVFQFIVRWKFYSEIRNAKK